MEPIVTFIDTSVFISQNLLGYKIKHLERLSQENVLHLKITDIVYKELLSHIRQEVQRANTSLKQVKTLLNKEGRILRNVSAHNDHFGIGKVNEDEYFGILKNKLDRFIEDNEIEIVTSEYIDVSPVIDQYFEGKPPFGSKKKSEFPDALSINAAENYLKTDELSGFFISQDNDFKEYESSHINTSYNISTFLDHIVRVVSDKRTELLDALYEKSQVEIERALSKDYQDDITWAIQGYLDADPYIEYPDVVSSADFESEILIGVINEIESDTIASYEVEALTSLIVEIDYIDLDGAIYDKEERRWVGERTGNMTKTFNIHTISVVEFFYDLEYQDGSFSMVRSFSISDIEDST